MNFSYDDTAAVQPGSRLANHNLPAWLAIQYDHGSAPRMVLHYAYLRPGANRRMRSAVTLELRLRGLAVDDTSLCNGLVFAHQNEIAMERFDALTVELAELLDGCSWDYDAWESEPQPDTALDYWRTLTGIELRRARPARRALPSPVARRALEDGRGRPCRPLPAAANRPTRRRTS
jgi:hypothetical protein